MYCVRVHTIVSVQNMMSVILQITACLAILQTVVSDAVAIQRSLLFPLFTPNGGKDFDDGTYAIVPPVAGVQSLRVRYGDHIDGLQVTYVLQDGQTIRGAWHGGMGGNSTHSVRFGKNEIIVRVEGYSKFGPPNGFLTQLNFFTRDSAGKMHKYGPIGEHSTKYRFLFNFAGVVVGFFGESGEYLNGIGFEYNNSITLPHYKKTPLTGGKGGRHFDDDLPNLGPLRMTHMTIHYGEYINGINTTYLLPNGSEVSKVHGTVQLKNGTTEGQLAQIDFAEDERISLLVVGQSDKYVNFLKFFTWRSKVVGSEYGPYGWGQDAPWGNLTSTYDGVINGFYGRSRKLINALGFYT